MGTFIIFILFIAFSILIAVGLIESWNDSGGVSLRKE